MGARDKGRETAKVAARPALPPKLTGAWTKRDDYPEPNGPKVFSCFHCGGGSTMGYKLAGCDVLGGVEIDKRMSALYVKNHRPKHEYLMGVQEFRELPDALLPKELFELDVLDGSPPCSSFSMAGSREKKWGKASKFREGQAVQVLDDLFGEFLKVAAKLKPKVVIAENVKGMLAGNAKGYVREVLAGFRALGYDTQLFLVDASRAGVPQIRERVFFVARRRDLELRPLELSLNETRIALRDALRGCETATSKKLTESTSRLWHSAKPGENLSKVHMRGMRWNWCKLSPSKPAPTLASTDALMKLHWNDARTLSDGEIKRTQSFPEDYDFGDEQAGYVCGMSVPPFLTQRVALAIREQWLG